MGDTLVLETSAFARESSNLSIPTRRFMETWPRGLRRRTANAEHHIGVIRSNRILSAILFCGDVCEWLKQLTRKVRGPAKTRTQRFESSRHRPFCFGSAGHLVSLPRSKRVVLRDVSVRLAPLPPVWRDGRVRFMALALKARAPSGAAGSNPRSLRHDVHVRQIRLAAESVKLLPFWVLEVQILSHAPELLLRLLNLG